MIRRAASGRAALIFAAMLFTGIAPSSALADFHGAIAFSQVSGAEGYSYDFSDRAVSESQAMAECEKRGGGCRIATWFRNACGALAVGRGNGFGASWGPTRYAAERRAVEICARNTTGCAVRRWVCTSGRVQQ